MVRLFLVHTVCPVPGLPSGGSRILFRRSFGPDEAALEEQSPDLSPDLGPDLSPEERRLLQREKEALVARQVSSAVLLSRAASSSSSSSSSPPLEPPLPGEEVLALQECSSGVVRLRAGAPFSDELSAPWISVQSVVFTLLCEPHENLLLAQNTLRNLVLHSLEQLHMLGQGSEVLLRSNRLDVLLTRLLPHGQLLFLNHRFLQSLEKEVQVYMSK